LIFVLIGLFCIVNGVELAMRNHREGHWQVLAFEDGILLIRGAEKKVLRWSDVTSLGQDIRSTVSWGNWEDPGEGIPMFSYHVYSIYMQSCEKYIFSGVKVEPLCDLIQKKIKRHILSRAVAVYNSGGTVQFESISISQTGIGNEKETVPWQEVEQVSAYEGTITIKKRKKLWRQRIVSFDKVQNAFVLPAAGRHPCSTSGLLKPLSRNEVSKKNCFSSPPISAGDTFRAQ
jgi:hypothetical protein